MPEPVEPDIPEAIRVLADARAMARAGKDWPEADRLRAELEAAGWKVVDRGFSYSLEPAHPPTLEAGGVIRYGRSADVPSRLDEPATGLATVVLVATDWPADLGRTLGAIGSHRPAELQVVVVADGPSHEQQTALLATGSPIGETAPEGGPEIVWTSGRLGHAAALNAGIRRALAPVVILMDTSVEVTGDAVTPLVRVLDDPTVGVAGPWGFRSEDLRRFEEVTAGPADAIGGYCQAFRREDVVSRGPLDEHFRFYRNLDIWWSLVLRDEGEGRTPRRAVVVPDLPLVRHEHRGWTSVPDSERDRLSKRNFYRILDRYGSRTDLVVDPRASRRG
jgi:hypothetical protein